jgi:hypothetical protein
MLRDPPQTEPSTKIIRTMCRNCHGGCGVLVTVKNGKAIEIKGDFDRITNLGYLCPKGRYSISYANHPDRITHPMKRVGPRGADRWSVSPGRRRWICWRKCKDAISNYGPEYIGKACGTGRVEQFRQSLLHALGWSQRWSLPCAIFRASPSEKHIRNKDTVADFTVSAGNIPSVC